MCNFFLKGFAYFRHIWKAARLKGIVGVAVQEAGTEDGRTTGGAGGGEGGPPALIRRDQAGCKEERERESQTVNRKTVNTNKAIFMGQAASGGLDNLHL